MTRTLSAQLTTDMAEFERLVVEVERAKAAFDISPRRATAERAAAALIACGKQARKISAYLRPALEAWKDKA